MQNANSKQPVSQQQKPGPHILTTAYQGNVPPPDMLEAFNRINSGYSDKIIGMALAASARQDELVKNQRAQIENDHDIRDKEVAANERLKTIELNGRNRDSMMKNISSLVGVVSASVVCFVLLYFAFLLLQADKTGYALGMASPVIGATLVAAIKILRK